MDFDLPSRESNILTIGVIVISNMNVLNVKPKSESCMFYVECTPTVLTNNFTQSDLHVQKRNFIFKFH